MKKCFAFILVFSMLLVSSALAETVPNVTGDWYANLDGAAIHLSLTEDGSYAFSVPGSEQVNGAWELKDGFVYLDGDESTPLSFNGPTLANADAGLFFTREQPEVYAPVDLLPNASVPLFAGLWRSAYTLQNGAALSAGFTEDDTLIYIEELKAILKGGPFGYRLVDLAFENGALTCAAGDMTVCMEFQQDGFLRLTTEKDGQTETRILIRTALEDTDGTADE